MSRKNAGRARRRAEIILQVRSGQMTVSQAARALGVSHKTYYQWEKRGLQALMESLENREPGRPSIPKPDPEKIRLEKKVSDLEKRLEMMAEVFDLREMLSDLRESDQTKKNTRGKKKR
ncbi:MAG: helix-turn-helix domain-containing protein [Verrucomicrobiae bacterium]|nr:helix-turn-helix domain-containing protein [Verrucomicrobiae bacterium]